MNKATLEYIALVVENLAWIGQKQVEAANGAHALYFLENDVVPVTRVVRDLVRKELGWTPVSDEAKV